MGIYVSYDGKAFTEFTTSATNDGLYLLRANLTVRAVRIKMNCAAPLTELSLISECLSYFNIDTENEIRDTESWSITASSYLTQSPPKNLIDGDITTIWHSYYNNEKNEQDKPPIDIVVDFGSLTGISGFNYYPVRSLKDSDSAGYFKSISVAVAFDEGEDAAYYPIANDTYSYSGYYNVQSTVFDFCDKYY